MQRIASNALARLLADTLSVGCQLAAGVAVARALGPAGKGAISALLYLSVLMMYLSTVGLEDAGVVAVKSGRASLAQVVRATTGAVALTSSIGAAALFVIANAQISSYGGSIKTAILITCVGLPAAALSYVLTSLINARDQLVFSSMVIAVCAIVNLALTVILVGIFGVGPAGVAIAALAAAMVGVAISGVRLSQLGAAPIPVVDPRYVRSAVGFGMAVVAANLSLSLAQRVDQLFVLGFSGAVAAGQYAVALTASQFVGFVPLALGVATFPRLAGLGETDARALTSRVGRAGLLGAAVTAAVVACAVPVLVPFAFGHGFSPAITPALILLVGALFGSERWLLCRAVAARGWPGLQFASVGASLASLVLLDVLLIPRYGPTGAAIGATIASLVGLMVCLSGVRKYTGLRIFDLLPRPSDAAEFAHVLRSTFGIRSSPGRSG